MIKKIKKIIQIENKTLLDFGAGHGYFVDSLIKNTKKSQVAACDNSLEAINFIQNRFKNEKHFLRTYTVEQILELKEKTFDVIFLTEVLEHLFDYDIEKTFTTFKRILKPNGYIVITIPNNEDVESRKVFCPNCGSLFHQVQHLKGYSTASLKELLKSHGFTAKYVQPISFTTNHSFKNIVKGIFLLFNKEKRSNIIGIFKS